MSPAVAGSKPFFFAYPQLALWARACFKNASAAQIAPGLKPEDGWEEAIFAGSKEPRSTD